MLRMKAGECKEPIGDLGCRGMAEGLASKFQQLARACGSPNNSTTEFCIRRWRAASAIVHLVRQTQRFLQELNIRIITIHIPGKENTTVDALSRLHWLRDYKIKEEFLLPALTAINFSPKLDGFAFQTIEHCRGYCSPQDDRRTIVSDAFSILWTDQALILYSPIGAKQIVIQKLKRDGETAELRLPSQSWMKFKVMFP
ncbi:MAG: hypothetical protein EZS28_046492, partial [Streblomastix strix]